ncbi:MAG TPA: glycosyltransferase family 2 protein [Vicinamibacterales bacterium]|nr:glycosyltransferase family 2 protein [Vicinamibacterales bacterium]
MSASLPSRSLSIVIPAYCEADNILQTLENVTRALSMLPIVHEVIVIDDGSTDGTADLVTSQAHRFPDVRLLVNDRNRGFGWSYQRGVDAATLENIVMVHGDNAWGHETLQQFFQKVGDADVIVGYTRAMSQSRTWTRTIVSKTFTWLLNLITRRRLHYYNGLQIHPASVLKPLRIESTGYGFQAEVLVKSLRLTRTFVEVPMDLIERKHGESKAFRVANVIDVMQTIVRLWALEWTSAAKSTAVQAAGR